MEEEECIHVPIKYDQLIIDTTQSPIINTIYMRAHAQIPNPRSFTHLSTSNDRCYNGTNHFRLGLEALERIEVVIVREI